MKKPKTATDDQKRFCEEKNQRDKKKSVYLLSAIMGTTALVMFIINILNEYYLISLLSFSYVIISIVSLVIFKKTHNYKVWTHSFLTFTFISAISYFTREEPKEQVFYGPLCFQSWLFISKR